MWVDLTDKSAAIEEVISTICCVLILGIGHSMAHATFWAHRVLCTTQRYEKQPEKYEGYLGEQQGVFRAIHPQGKQYEHYS
jgi:hypothetical protein